MKKRVAILGATGSIGKSALDVISKDPDNFEVVLLSARSRITELEQLKKQFPSAVCVNNNLLDAIRNVQPDITVNGIAGSAGLEPSIAAIKSGSNLALANKETIVMAGELVLKLAKEMGVNIIPVDSEHSAIYHLINGLGAPSEIILTASGGPFRKHTIQEMQNVTVEDALAHPTWNMGTKITIDSASMANKGLEIIEACILFKIQADNVKVVVHPQSIVHSMIRMHNGAFYAQLSKPDMRNPIADALYWPEIAPPAIDPLSFDSLTLEFEKPDTNKFPILNLAWEAARLGKLYPCVYNAANEEAVSCFISNKCGFLDIPKIAEYVLQMDWSKEFDNIEAVLEADKKARLEAVNFIQKMR
ncbi:MAG: 1-deoxy-D-xylulose-5-phosphate reductoisomerase [Treponema sp.]|jgi:1-deoxy-D-xylulose-5-phosphate reductoisomerase|nr:1-deoxy-D-xylulose-5-phosphate reductoisomerase [Treponema sp.]